MGLFVGAVDLQVAHDDVAPIFMLKEYKRIGHEETGGVKHVGVAFTGGVQQDRLIRF